MTFIYTAYDLWFQSDTLLPGLQEHSQALKPLDLSIWFNQPFPGNQDELVWAPHPNEISSEESKVFITDDGEYYQIRYSDGVNFIIDRFAREIWVGGVSTYTLGYVVSYVTNPILGFCLRIRNILCLHASAVVINNKAVLFSAPSGFGKSTTAFHLASLGYPVLSDDICALEAHDGVFYVRPGYPHLRLWSVPVMDERVALKAIAPEWKKQYVDLQSSEGYSFIDKPVPLGAIYFLCYSGDEIEFIAPQVRRALTLLMNNIYHAYLTDSASQKSDFVQFLALLEKVPVRAVVYPDDLNRLEELGSRFLEDYTSLSN